MSGGYGFDLIQLLHKIQTNMTTSNDYPLNLNPAYQNERKPEYGCDSIMCPIFNEEGDEIEKECIVFEYAQYDREMHIYLYSFKAHRDDVTNMIQDLYKNFNIEYK